LEDLQELRSAIEPEAVRLAALRATEDDILALENAYHAMAAAVAAGNEEDYIQADYAFHIGLLRASQNAMFTQVGRAIGSMLREVFLITTRTPDDGIARSLPFHWEIVEKIRARDSEGAYACSKFQIDRSRKDLAAGVSRSDSTAP
jgi:DNA-binding FadR family transcriptional regulator